MVTEEQEKMLMKALALRMMSMAIDPINYRLLERAVDTPPTIEELHKYVGLSRVTIERRVNEMEQVGLAIRERGRGG